MSIFDLVMLWITNPDFRKKEYRESWISFPQFRDDENFLKWGVKTEDISGSHCGLCGQWQAGDTGDIEYPPDWRWTTCVRCHRLSPTSNLFALNNAELLERGSEPHPGEAKRLYDACHNIIRNRGTHYTTWGFLPWVSKRKLKEYIFDWACTVNVLLIQRKVS